MKSVPFMVTAVALILGQSAWAQAPGNHYMCYQAALAKGQPKFAGDTKSLQDQFAGPQPFDVKKIVEICNPADKNSEGIPYPLVHEEGYQIRPQKGAPKFVAVDRTVTDQFGSHPLTISKEDSLLDVTPKALGSTPPALFATDPTEETPDVNRFKCYKAKLAKGQPKFVPPPDPIVADEFVTGQAFTIKKITKLCAPVDKESETPGAETRPGHLLCYQVKLPKGAPKFIAPTIATNDDNFAPHVLVAKKPKELCVPALAP